MECISSAFEGCKVADGQEHLLTVAPPIPLGPDYFTKEELESYGMSTEDIGDLMETGEWLLQWGEVPQDWAPAAPIPPMHLSMRSTECLDKNKGIIGFAT